MYKMLVEFIHAKVTIKTEIVKSTREECISYADWIVENSTAYSYNIISEGAANE